MSGRRSRGKGRRAETERTAASAPVMRESDLADACRAAAEAMGAFLAVVGQRKAKGSGSTVGFPDLVLICGGEVALIELKRPATDEHPRGCLSLGQQVFIERAAEQGVTVHVVDSVEAFAAVVNHCRRAKGVRRAVSAARE